MTAPNGTGVGSYLEELGYGPHFAERGNRFGPFDLAVIECGKFNEASKYIHLNPEETVRAAQDVRAAAFVPVHWGKFTLAFHAWDEPIDRVSAEGWRLGVRVLRPMNGSKMPITDTVTTARWWERHAPLQASIVAM